MPRTMTDALSLAQALIQADSVTPARGSVFDVLEAALVPLGFAVDRFTVGEEPDGPVENLLATRSGTGTHLAFAGHVDVVPAGDGWQGSPFSGEVRDGLLFGRGAVDMKGAVAAFVAAIPAEPGIPCPHHHGRRGRPRHLWYPRADRSDGRAWRRPRPLPGG